MARIGIDLDGVCYDFTGAFCELQGWDPDEVRSWEFFKDHGHTTEWFLNECRDAVRAGTLFRYGGLIKGVKEAFDTLALQGHEVYIITDRCSIDPDDSALIKNNTVNWLKEHNLRYEGTVWTGDKAKACVDLGIDYLLDDKIENVEDVEFGTLTKAYLFDQGWNTKATHLERVYTWDQFVGLVQLGESLKKQDAGFVTKDSGERVQFDSGMRRDTNKGKPRFDLLVPEKIAYKDQLLTRFAELMARGAEKYDARNWEQGIGEEELARFRESAFRHFFQWLCGETDEDHAVATIFNIMGAEYNKTLMPLTEIVEAKEENVA